MEMKDKLLFIRAKMDMSQESLARVLGVSFATVNRWEKGKCEPGYKAQKAFNDLCEKNNIDPNYLANN